MPYRDGLPVLELVLATPCTARWESMLGTDQVRHCNICSKHVYDLNALDRAEAEAVIVSSGGRLCARYFRRHDGTIMLRDCDDGLRLRMAPEVIAFWITVIIAGALTLSILAIYTARGGSLGSVG